MGNENKCPNFPGCKLCINNKCEFCDRNSQKDGDICVKCDFDKILYDNQCRDSTLVEFSDLNSKLNDGIYNNGILILKLNLESLKDASNEVSSTKIFKNTISYANFDFEEKADNFLNLINLENFKTKEFHIFFKDSEGSQNFYKTINCLNPKYLFKNDENDGFKGNCEENCDNKMIKNQFCIIPMYSCSDFNQSANRCKNCEGNYLEVELVEGIVYFLPEKFETDFFEETNNEIISINDLNCGTFNCFLCSLDTLTCYLCKKGFFLISDSCVEGVKNCINHELDLTCSECDLEYHLFFDLNRCIKNSSFILNCIDFNENEDQFCNLCEDGYFLYKDNLPPYDCINNNFILENCKTYSEGPEYLCTKCFDDFFFFEFFENFLIKICLNKNYLVNNCLNFDQNQNFICSECEMDHSIVEVIGNQKLCLNDDDKIANCRIYNQIFQCEEFNKICTAYNTQDCPICDENFMLVNGKCYDICSQEALNCEICENQCPIYLSMKLVLYCLECNSKEFSECIRCPEYLVLRDGRCVEKKEELNPKVYENIKCEKGCVNCIGKLCVKCKFNYIFDKKKYICIKKQKIFEKILIKDECKEKKLICFFKNKLKFSHCEKCRFKCKCNIEYKNNLAFFNCKKDSAIFYKKETIKFVELKKIILHFHSENELMIIFKNDNIKEAFFQIPQKLIFSTTNCSLNLIEFIKVKNQKYSDPKINKTAGLLIKYNSAIIPLLSSILSNWLLAYLLIICQIQEIFSYLFLINFNGGTFFNFINSSEFNLKSFNDMVDSKNMKKNLFLLEINIIFFILLNLWT